MCPRERRTVFAVASPSLLVPAGREMAIETDGYHAMAASPPLGGSAVIAAPEEETETDADADSCSWRASGVPPIAPPVGAATGLVVVEPRAGSQRNDRHILQTSAY